jgi:hypothetical protein
MKLEGIAQKIIKRMQEEGRVTTLSKEDSYKLDDSLARGLAPIKEEFYRKSRASMAYINQLESTTAEV